MLTASQAGSLIRTLKIISRLNIAQGVRKLLLTELDAKAFLPAVAARNQLDTGRADTADFGHEFTQLLVGPVVNRCCGQLDLESRIMQSNQAVTPAFGLQRDVQQESVLSCRGLPAVPAHPCSGILAQTDVARTMRQIDQRGGDQEHDGKNKYQGQYW